MSLQVEVNDPTNFAMCDSSRFALEAEAIGFAGVGMPDHPHTGRDVFVRLAAAAHVTEQIMLFPSVANPVTRNAETLATLARSLNEVAPGRTRLILGGGDNAVKFAGKQPATVAELIDAVRLIKSDLAGTGIKVFMNASSPRMLNAAGVAADGVYAMVGVAPEVIAAALEYVAEGAQSVGRNPQDVEVAIGLPVFVATSPERADETALPYAFSNLIRRTRVFSRVMRANYPVYDSAVHQSDLSPRDARTLTEAMVVSGSPIEVAERTKALSRALGQSHFIARVEFEGREPIAAMKAFGAQLMGACQ